MKNADLIQTLQHTDHHRLKRAAAGRIRRRVLKAFEDQSPWWPNEGRLDDRPYPVPAMLVAVVLVLAFVVITVAAESAKPGDILYDWDRGIENLRLALPLDTMGRTKYRVRLAEERAVELKQLRQVHQKTTAMAQQDLQQTLQHAITDLAEAKRQQTIQPEAGAPNELELLENRLRQVQQEQSQNSDPSMVEKPPSNSMVLTAAKAVIEDSSTTVIMETGGQESTFTLATTDMVEIVQSISQRTGLAVEEVTSVLTFENDAGKTPTESPPTPENTSEVQAHSVPSQEPILGPITDPLDEAPVPVQGESLETVVPKALQINIF